MAQYPPSCPAGYTVRHSVHIAPEGSQSTCKRWIRLKKAGWRVNACFHHERVHRGSSTKWRAFHRTREKEGWYIEGRVEEKQEVKSRRSLSSADRQSLSRFDRIDRWHSKGNAASRHYVLVRCQPLETTSSGREERSFVGYRRSLSVRNTVDWMSGRDRSRLVAIIDRFQRKRNRGWETVTYRAKDTNNYDRARMWTYVMIVLWMCTLCFLDHWKARFLSHTEIEILSRGNLGEDTLLERCVLPLKILKRF